MRNEEDTLALCIKPSFIQDDHLCHKVPRGAELILVRISYRVRRVAAIHKYSITYICSEKENINEHDESNVEDAYEIMRRFFVTLLKDVATS